MISKPDLQNFYAVFGMKTYVHESVRHDEIKPIFQLPRWGRIGTSEFLAVLPSLYFSCSEKCTKSNINLSK